MAGAAGEPVAFAGGPEGLSFVTPLRAGSGGLKLMRLAVAGHTLRLSWTPYRPMALSGDAGEAVVLQNLSGLQFRYFGAVGAGAASWHDGWTSMPVLPSLVSLTATREADGGKEELIVALHVTGTASSNRR